VIQRQLKLRLSPRQERQLDHWLHHLTAVWNWAIKRIERDAEIGLYHSSLRFRDILARHGRKIDVPQDALNGTLWTAHTTWQRCFKGLARKPRFKGRRNRLNSIAFAHGPRMTNGRFVIPSLGRVKTHPQDIPVGHISQMRILKRASGWYLCLFIKTEPNDIPVTGSGQIGIDSGFKSLLTLSTGEKISHPRELEISAHRLAQAQRGGNRRLAARISERIASQRKDRNHKLSRRLVAENQLIAFSADRHHSIAKRFGKSVASSGHRQIRQMFSYKSKCRTDGLGVYVEPESKNSTKTCSACGALTGPTGLAGLKVRQWRCDCGSLNDRDVNAAINTLHAALGGSVERRGIAA
jgi:transposase